MACHLREALNLSFFLFSILELEQKKNKKNTVTIATFSSLTFSPFPSQLLRTRRLILKITFDLFFFFLVKQIMQTALFFFSFNCFPLTQAKANHLKSRYKWDCVSKLNTVSWCWWRGHFAAVTKWSSKMTWARLRECIEKYMRGKLLELFLSFHVYYLCFCNIFAVIFLFLYTYKWQRPTHHQSRDGVIESARAASTR